MWKTRLLLGASLIALATSSSISANAGFDRRVNSNAGVGSGAYNNPYLPGQSQPQPGQTVTAQPGGGFGWGPGPWGFGFGGQPFFNLPGQSQPQPLQTGIAQPGGGFGLMPTPVGIFNLGSVSASSPWGGFSLEPGRGFFNLPGQSQPQQPQTGMAQPGGGFGWGGPPPFIGSWPAGFNLGPVGASSPWGSLNIGPISGGWPGGSFNLGPVGASWPGGGFGLPGFPGGYNLGPVSGSSPWGGFAIGGHISALPWGELGFGQQRDAPAWHGFNLGPVSASSPWGGFGFNPHASAPGGFNLIGPGWNLGQAPQPNTMQPAYSPYGCAPSGYPQQTGAPGQPAAPSGANRTALTQPVSCSINEISLLSRNVSDCEKAGGTVLAANAQQ